MDNPFFEHPVLNSPYFYPSRHWELDDQGQPTLKIIENRRRAEFITPIPKPGKRKGSSEQQSLSFDEGKGLSSQSQRYDPTPAINALRRHVDEWRALPNRTEWRVTPKTVHLLLHWRHHPFNNIRKFTRGGLVVTPELTIRDRLLVLQPNDPYSYYASRELVPPDMLVDLERAKIVITNYHAFKLRERMALSKGGRSLPQGPGGPALNTQGTEGQMLQRVMPGLMGMKNNLVVNDEAHHCYRGKSSEEDGSDLKGEERKEAPAGLSLRTTTRRVSSSATPISTRRTTPTKPSKQPSGRRLTRRRGPP